MVKALIRYNIYNSSDNKIYGDYVAFYCKKSCIENCFNEYIDNKYNDCLDKDYCINADVIVIFYGKYVLVVSYEVIEVTEYKIDNLYNIALEAEKKYKCGELYRFIYDYEDEEFKINVYECRDTILDLTYDLEYYINKYNKISKESIENYFK